MLCRLFRLRTRTLYFRLTLTSIFSPPAFCSCLDHIPVVPCVSSVGFRPHPADFLEGSREILAIINDYIARLKEESGCSWKDLERLTGYPSSTIRDHLTGKTAKIDIDIMIAVVSAMGGDPGQIAAVPQQLREDLAAIRSAGAQDPADPAEFRTTIETLQRTRAEMLELQRKSYERELCAVRLERDRYRRLLIIAVAVMISLMFFTILMLIYDLTHLDRGWITAFYGTGAGGIGSGAVLSSVFPLR